ncbi:MAG: Hpt domain-containing protein, partial [Alphaproteobacteria bacterium]|nr:Hpt domain-containing protein [Alphaproteobacteria bacterium]
MDDMINEFVTETTESLAMLDLELVKLEQNPQDTPTLSNIFRVMHTIKGTCGFLGLHRLEKVAHAGENILGKFRDGEIRVTPHAITLILQSIDCIKGIVDHMAGSGAEPAGDDSALIASLNHFAEHGNSDAPTVEAAPIAAGSDADMASFFKGDDDLEELIRQAEMAKQGNANSVAAPVAEKIIEQPVAKIAAAPVAAPAAPAAPAASTAHAEDKGTNAANQSIRINLDILEKMMQTVGELVLS